MNQPRKKLSDILAAGNGGNIRNIWNSVTAADDFAPLPPGEYTFRVLTGELFTAKKGTPGHKLTLEVTEGEYEGRRAWHDLWLTAPALPMTKRDLAKIGVTTLEQLERPLPAGILIRGKVVLHRDDDGNEVNKLKRFGFVGVEPGDAFEPADDGAGQASAAEPSDAFPFGANVSPSDGPALEPSSSGIPPAGLNGTPAPGALFPSESSGEADAAGHKAKDFLANERGQRR
jgi:hypothetical protein